MEAITLLDTPRLTEPTFDINEGQFQVGRWITVLQKKTTGVFHDLKKKVTIYCLNIASLGMMLVYWCLYFTSTSSVKLSFFFLNSSVYIAMAPSSTILKKSCFYLEVNVWE